MKSREKVRSIFISDIHLGFKYCSAEKVLDFIKSYDAEYVYLVGDIIDMWRIKKKLFWTPDHFFVIRRLIGMLKHGTKVIYITGNHDEFLREHVPFHFDNFALLNETTHVTLDNKLMLVIHGDIFDRFTAHCRWLYLLGDMAYGWAIWSNNAMNYVRRKLGLPYWSLSAILKRNVKKAVNFINDFEEFMACYAKDRGYDGVISGHIHHPSDKIINGLRFLNCGDFVESNTAIIETLDGEFKIIYL